MNNIHSKHSERKGTMLMTDTVYDKRSILKERLTCYHKFIYRYKMTKTTANSKISLKG